MRNILPVAAICLALAAGAASAASDGSHSIFAWNGNQYLFSAQQQGSVTYLTGYRAVGAQWRRVGATTLRAGQKSPEGGGFLQRIWFGGRKVGTVDVDFSSDQFRRARGGGRR